jgi:hypothetical protein
MFGFTRMFPAGALVDTDLRFCSSCPNALTSVPAPSFSLLRCLGLAMFNHAVLTIELPRNTTPFAIRTLWASDGYAARIYLTSSVRPEAAFSIT